MENSHQFSMICGKLCNLLYVKDYNKSEINSLIDELNAKPYKAEYFVRKPDATALVTALCLYIKPEDEFLAAKASHLMGTVLTKQKLKFDTDYLWKVIAWHVQCLKKCSVVILLDILHNMQCVLECNPQAGYKFTDELISHQGLLTNFVDTDKATLSSQNSLQMCLVALKCIISLTTIEEGKSEQPVISLEIKNHVSFVVIKFLLKGSAKSQDDFLYCKTVISALRVLSLLYFDDAEVSITLPEVMGICKHFILHGLLNQHTKPERIMPAQQTIAVAPVATVNTNLGKKQRTRKQKNNAIENLKKEIPVSDHSLMKDVKSFENNSAYKPASQHYWDPQGGRSCWAQTSDSDMSDVENSREAKLVALRSRVRQSAANLLLVLVKVRENREIFGYWWALLPDSPDAEKWSCTEAGRKTLAYCAVTDPIASSRVSVLSVILALLSRSRHYLSHAETSKKDTASFIPFSVSLGYVITCMHTVLVGILDTERNHSVIIVTLKCCAALVQATPYHKMKEGLISELVRSTRKFLVHREIKLQVGALITMGCILSVEPKVDELMKAIEKDAAPSKATYQLKENNTETNECDDFEEGYSDDEMFTAVDHPVGRDDENDMKEVHFKSWILDICFKHLGWMFRGDQITRCNPSAMPAMLESLQVLSAIAFHHLSELLLPHLLLLGDILADALQSEHQNVTLHAAMTVSIVGDALQKQEKSEQPPPLSQCVRMWEGLLNPLSRALQSEDLPHTRGLVCDCLANIGERAFKQLPRRQQLLCCALLVGSCSDEEAVVRAAAVRALAMAVMYRTLRQDISFVSDCGENILRALAERTLVVRTKAAWALGNLSEALVLNMEDPEADELDDDLLFRLLKVSIQCANDHDKVKISAPRGLGNLLRLVSEARVLRNAALKPLCETAIAKLMDCACKVANMKMRWNACYAMGNAMKNDSLFTCFTGWQHQVFPSLTALAQDCKNLKVRINAAAALRAPTTREQYGGQFGGVWKGLMGAMETAAHFDDFTEYNHKDNLIEHLCVTLAHMCCLLSQSDLTDILDALVFHGDCARGLFAQLCRKLPPENASCMKILQAAKYVTVDLTAGTDAHEQALGILQEIFIWDM